MTTRLYEEALADVKRIKQVAEDNAKRIVFEAVTPRIREFIDSAILEGEISAAPSPADDEDGEVLSDIVVPSGDVSAPVTGDVAGVDDQKVTLNINAICEPCAGSPVDPPMFGKPVDPDGEYEINLESVEALKPVLSLRPVSMQRISKMNEEIEILKKAGQLIRSTPTVQGKIAQMISYVDDMYGYVQERVSDPAKKNMYETMLEASFNDLKRLQEPTTMSQKNKKSQMNEGDVTLKLTGLPEDIDLDAVGVDLITGDEDEVGDQDGGQVDDFDFGDDQATQQGGQDDQQLEARHLSDDTIVEVDEKMLRREISRLRNARNLREVHTGTGGSETKPQSWGHGPDHFDSFGDGRDDGEPMDADIVDKSPAPGALPLGESDDQDLDEGQDDLDEQDDQDDLDEADMPAPAGMDQGDGMDQLDQLGNRRKEDEYGPDVSDGHGTETWDKRRHEARVRLNAEKKLQERARSRTTALKEEAGHTSSPKKMVALKKEYRFVAQKFNESVARAKKLTQFVVQATKKLQEQRSNNAARPAESPAANSLRKKLAETNLFNAKLLYTNKLLQNEQLTQRQKVQVIKQLDTVTTVREAKLVYDSLANTLAGSSKPVNENHDRKIIGSGSKATRPASTQTTLNEGYEADRWARLAGITKR